MKLGVFLPNWVGDVVMATPTLRALARHFGPQATIVGIGRPMAREVLAGTPWLSDFELFDPRSSSTDLRAWSLARRLRKRRLDAAVLLTNSFRTAMVAFAAGIVRRVGYARSLRGPLLTRALTPFRQNGRYVPSPALDYYLELAYALGCAKESPRMELATVEADELAADAAWGQFRGRPRRVAVLNTYGAFGPAKHWPEAYAAALARRLAVELDLGVIVLCGPRERDAARRIARAADHGHVISLADMPLGVGLSKACVRRGQLMVSTDSGPRHFAAAFGLPVVTLFGPTDIAWSETHYSRATHVQLELDCVPCQKRECPLVHHRCMRELTVDRVFRAARAALDATPQTKAA